MSKNTIRDNARDAVIISIRPNWCELIVTGQKTVEVRKTTPKLNTPFTCYIYETKEIYTPHLIDSKFRCQGVGKVIGEFICDEIERFHCTPHDFEILSGDRKSCVTIKELESYCGGRDLYGWHISNLSIYETPISIIEFSQSCINKCNTNIMHAPQSWCYCAKQIKE